MPLIGETGKLTKTSGEVQVKWEIPDMLSSTEEVGSFYESPVFSLSDSCWCLRIYLNGEKRNKEPGCIGLYIFRKDSGPPKTVAVSLGVKKHDGVKWRSQFDSKLSSDSGSGTTKFLLRSNLLNQKSQFMLSNVLTVICKLKCDIPHCTEVSLFKRLWDVSRDMKKILDAGERTDFVVNLNGHELHAHKMILEIRCDYFAGMFGHNLQENTSGVGVIEDIEKGVFKCVLSYIYSGEAEGMSKQNVCKIYAAADKLLLNKLKDLCIEYMKENLSPNLVSDIIAVAEKYEEENLNELARDYFIKNAAEVFVTEEWKTFKEQNGALSSQLLENIIVERLQRLKV